MKYFVILCICLGIGISCNKSSQTIDGSNQKTFDISVEKLKSDLEDIEKTKLDEAIKIIFTYDTHMDTDELKWSRTRQMLNGKTAHEIISIAENTAFRNGVSWDRNSMEALVFNKIQPLNKDTLQTSVDYSIINEAKSLSIIAKEIDTNKDGVEDGLMIFLPLLDAQNLDVNYSNIPLKATISLSQNDNQVYLKSENFDNSSIGKPSLERGIYISYTSLNPNKISGNKFDVEAKLYTPETYKSAFQSNINTHYNEFKMAADLNNSEKEADKMIVTGVVQSFLQSLNSQDLRKAYSYSANAEWADYQKFSSKDLGFGNVSSVDIEGITMKNYDGVKDKATVEAQYILHFQDGNSLHLRKDFRLQKISENWKIVSTQKL